MAPCTLTLTLALALTLCDVTAGDDSPCPYRGCRCTDALVDCTSRHLAAIPQLKHGDFPQATLWLDYNPVGHIGGGQLKPELEEVTCYVCKSLASIDDAAFRASASTLTKLEISYSTMTQLPRALTSLTALEQLKFTNGRLTDISTQLPSTLERLFLNHNNIQTITKLTFKDNKSSLFLLDLDNNPLTHISPSAFNQLSQLETLVLYATSLNRLPLAITSLTQLTFLHFSYGSNLTCTCQEAALAPWFAARDDITIRGTCLGGSTVTDFLTRLAPNCPPSN